MALFFEEKDIVTMQVDAIVNAANEGLWRGGGVCGAIFLAAGADELEAECQKKAPCPVGEAVITGGYRLPAQYIIHAVGPRYRDGHHGERELLAGAYRSALELARQYKCRSIAFPLISAGIFGYPREEALAVAVETIRTFLDEHDMDVYLTLFGRPPVRIPEELARAVEACPREWEQLRYETLLQQNNQPFSEALILRDESPLEMCDEAPCPAPPAPGSSAPQISAAPKQASSPSFLPSSTAAQLPIYGKPAPRRLDDLLEKMDETFSDMLLRLIDEKDYTDVEVYKRANLNRKLFSKIRSNRDYMPKKSTVFAFAIALRLSEDEAIDLLEKAGYAFSDSRKLDVIIHYYIKNEEYNIDLINETLLYYGQALLGSSDK